MARRCEFAVFLNVKRILLSNFAAVPQPCYNNFCFNIETLALALAWLIAVMSTIRGKSGFIPWGICMFDRFSILRRGQRNFQPRDNVRDFVFGMRLVHCILLLNFVLWLVPGTLLAQGRSKANSRQIDPVRAGDDVEVKHHFKWLPGTVLSYENGQAEVEYLDNKKKNTDSFSDKDMRFPNGEGHWTIWKDNKNRKSFAGRYITRDENEVMIRKEDGTDVTMPINDLSLSLKQKVRRTPIPGDENKINGTEPFRAGDRVQVTHFNSWHDGEVIKLEDGKVEVTYDRNNHSRTEFFDFEKVRFPDGEGVWREWKSAAGNFTIIARYLERTATHVTLLKENGQEVSVPIEKLSRDLRKMARKTPITGKENLVNGVSPVRRGDRVEVKSTWDWHAGVVTDVTVGQVMVEYEEHSRVTKKAFDLNKVRFPAGQSQWMKWRNVERTKEFVARYIRRTDTHAILLKEDGSEFEFEIEKLEPKLKRLVEDTVSFAQRPEKIEFLSSPRTTNFMNQIATFSSLQLSDSEIEPVTAVKAPADGGFGFELTNGNEVSRVIATGVNDWVAIGTNPSSRFKGYGITRLYWANPAEQKVVNGSGFSDDERIVDYSAKQNRLITVQLSNETWPKPIAFCTYRTEPGKEFADPEWRWDIAERKRSFGRAIDYRARLVGDNQLLLADQNTLSLYDFKKAEIVYSLAGIDANFFVLHPSKNFFLVRKQGKGLSLHRTETGKQIAFDPDFENSGGCGFSQDGRKLIGLDRKYVNVWDLTVDAAPKKFDAGNLSSQRNRTKFKDAVTMIDDQWIWSSSYLYNTEKEMLVWGYQGGGVRLAGRDMLGDRLLVSGVRSQSRGPAQLLVGVAKIPHQEAVDEMNKIDVKTMTMLERGVGVKIDAPGDRRVRAGIEAAMKVNGWVADPNSEIIISGSAKRGKTVKEEYRQFGIGRSTGRGRTGGGGNGTISRSFTPWVQSVAITYRGQTAWRSGRSSGSPYSASSVKELDASLNKASQASYSLFENLTIPETLFYPHFSTGLGHTEITPTGFFDKLHKPSSTDAPAK